ncbi:MAG: Adenine DNA glycosylase [Chlamydiales bacterium]|nr:Adenine DNA glycosylase [Chlamydiales bacterium]MCH9620490.1 Adenine DNA glycosylase [Chlamydiales bacterium]MCH9623475.1 Adenine DNA glycosylase [Chlamydiales bacterium]
MLRQSLKKWFLSTRRDLPWRASQNPYHVWVSEIMLQQTQVSVVIPYFNRWIKAFPTIEALAEAPIERVIKLWEGLGYYSRARNLHAAAQLIVEKFDGKLPDNRDGLLKIKGIGPYTQGAILSFAFHQKAPAIDGNVTRVISRLTGFEDKKEIEQYVETFLPDEEPWVVMEGLIELGALVCTKKPSCSSCPFRSSCYAYRHQLTEHLPKKKKRQKMIHLKRIVAIITCQEHYLLQQVDRGVMKDLFEFPYLDDQEDVKQAFEEALDLPLRHLRPLTRQTHGFTRYQAELFPHLFETDQRSTRYLWKKKKELFAHPFSSGHRRILLSL